jgi:hypothetical protein
LFAASMNFRPGPKFEVGPFPIPPNRQLANDIHRFFSIKAGMRTVTCESWLEAGAAYIAEGTADVIFLCEQGFRLNCRIGKSQYYTFDLVKRYRNGDEPLIEVKPVSKLVPARDGTLKPPHWDEIEDACRQIGRVCEFITDKDIESQRQFIDNWRVLLPFVRSACVAPDPELLDRILDRCSGGYPVAIRDIANIEPRRSLQDTVAHIALLLHRGDLEAPLRTEPINRKTMVRCGSHVAR